MGKPVFPDLSSWPDESWIKDKLPERCTMPGPQSWLLFKKLGLSGEDLDWLDLDFVRGLTIDNDPAERGVGLIKQFISSFQTEESCQDNLLAVSEHRKTVSKDSSKEDLAKIGLK